MAKCPGKELQSKESRRNLYVSSGQTRNVDDIIVGMHGGVKEDFGRTIVGVTYYTVMNKFLIKLRNHYGAFAESLSQWCRHR